MCFRRSRIIFFNFVFMLKLISAHFLFFEIKRCVFSVFVCVSMYVYKCVIVCMSICVCVFVCVSMYAYLCMCVYVCVCVCMHVDRPMQTVKRLIFNFHNYQPIANKTIFPYTTIHLHCALYFLYKNSQ